MRKAKRGGDHLTRGSRKSRSASKNESLVSGCLLGDSDQGVSSGVSDRPVSYLSKSVASIALYNGETILFSCSGIAMERQGDCHLTRFLTSASLVRAVNGANKDHDDLKIEVRPEGHEVYMGVMDEFDLDRNFVVVNVHAFLDVQVGSFQHALQIMPRGEILVLIGRGVSGEIIAKNVEFDGYSRVSEDDEDLDCKTSEAWDGGPLVSDDGKVVGMNLFLTARRAVFLPWGTILKHLEHYWASQQKKTGLSRSKTSKVYRFGTRPIGEKSNSHPEVHGDFLTQEQLDLYYMGYPKLPSSMLGACMSLVNSFEETFGDLYGEGVWRNFGKRASNIDRNVVALASFNGNFTEKKGFLHARVFLLNGTDRSTVILTSASLVRDSGDENKIVENLRAGIGGPLVTRDGDVIGMNFYDKKIGTPFLGFSAIYEILTSFETKSKPGGVRNGGDLSGASFWKIDGDNKTKLNRWPVPMPRWCNPDYVDEDKSVDDEPVFDCINRFALRYGYVKGEKVILF